MQGRILTTGLLALACAWGLPALADPGELTASVSTQLDPSRVTATAAGSTSITVSTPTVVPPQPDNSDARAFLDFLGNLEGQMSAQGVGDIAYTFRFQRVDARTVKVDSAAVAEWGSAEAVLTYALDETSAGVRLDMGSQGPPRTYGVRRVAPNAFVLTDANSPIQWTFLESGDVEVRSPDRSMTYRRGAAAETEFRNLAAKNQQVMRQIEAENALTEVMERQRDRIAEMEGNQRLADSYNKMVGDLSDHAAREAQISSEADAMVARTNAQAEAHQLAQLRTDDAGADRAAGQVASSQIEPTTTPAQSVGVDGLAEAGAPAQPDDSAGGTMTFMLGISLNTVINRMNGQCFSNLISVPGPPGWPGNGPGRGNGEEARSIVRKYFPEFLAKCGQIAPVGRGEPFYVWNSGGNEARLHEEYARAQRNQMAEVHISP